MPNKQGIWSLSEQYQTIAQQEWLQAPSAPLNLSSSVDSNIVIISFDAPNFTGNPSGILDYRVTNLNDGSTTTGSSSPITVTGLTNGVNYNFIVQARNSIDFGESSSVISDTPLQVSQNYTTPGTYSWVAPSGVTSVNVIAVGGGGGGVRNGRTDNGGRGFNGGNSYFIDTSTVSGFGGKGGTYNSSDWSGYSQDQTHPVYGAGGSYVGDGGGDGGASKVPNVTPENGFYGGGGAGGYAGNGGAGGKSNGYGSNILASESGSGGGGGGGCWAGGGGVGIFGEGASGQGEAAYQSAGKGGSGGEDGNLSFAGSSSSPTVSKGGNYGGGGGGTYSINGGGGGLGWKNNISVTPGNSYTVVVGDGGLPNYQWEYGGQGGGGAVRLVWAAGSQITSTPNPKSLPGQQAYTTAGTYSWVAPSGVDSISVVVIGAGGAAGGYGAAGAGGGGLSYKNNLAVTPGTSYTVIVGNSVTGPGGYYGEDGEASSFNNTIIANGGGGTNSYNQSQGGNYSQPFGPGPGGTASGGDANFTGGSGGSLSGNGSSGSGNGGGGGTSISPTGGGGGGAAGYGVIGGSGSGGTGGVNIGGTGSGGGGGGGGTSIYGTAISGNNGGDASRFSGGSGGLYGGGSGASGSQGGPRAGARGAVRIIWPGDTRQFPSTLTQDL